MLRYTNIKNLSTCTRCGAGVKSRTWKCLTDAFTMLHVYHAIFFRGLFKRELNFLEGPPKLLYKTTSHIAKDRNPAQKLNW